MLRRPTLARLAILCGVLAPVVWASAIVFCASLRPEYSHVTQYISELGERGSATESIMRYTGFVPTGLMHLAFAAFLYAAFKGSPLAAIAALLLAINGVARIGAGMFPCEVGCALPRVLLSQKLHTLAAATGFFALIGATILWGIVFRRYHQLRDLSAYSIGTGCVGLIFLALMSASGDSRTAVGLYERLSSGILSLWVLVFALRLWSLEAYRLASFGRLARDSMAPLSESAGRPVPWTDDPSIKGRQQGER